MHVAIVSLQLHIPHSRSLKQKRAAVKPIVEGLRHRFNLSVAEVGYQDKWQRASIAMAVVSGTHRHAVEVLEGVERWVWSRPDIEVSRFDAEWVRTGDDDP